MLSALGWCRRWIGTLGSAARCRGDALVLLSGFAVLGGILTFGSLSHSIAGLLHRSPEAERSIDSAPVMADQLAHFARRTDRQRGNAAIEALRNNQAKLSTSGALFDRSHHYRAGYRGGAGTVHARFFPSTGAGASGSTSRRPFPGQRP